MTKSLNVKSKKLIKRDNTLLIDSYWHKLNFPDGNIIIKGRKQYL